MHDVATKRKPLKWLFLPAETFSLWFQPTARHTHVVRVLQDGWMLFSELRLCRGLCKEKTERMCRYHCRNELTLCFTHFSAPGIIFRLLYLNRDSTFICPSQDYECFEGERVDASALPSFFNLFSVLISCLTPCSHLTPQICLSTNMTRAAALPPPPFIIPFRFAHEEFEK